MPNHMPQLIFVSPHVYIQIQELLQSIDFYVVVFHLFDFNFALHSHVHFDGCDIQAINQLVDGCVPPFSLLGVIHVRVYTSSLQYL